MNESRLAPAAAMVAPVQLLVGLVIFVPAIYVFALSLTQSSFGQAPAFVGLANYAQIPRTAISGARSSTRSSSSSSSCMSSSCSGSP